MRVMTRASQSLGDCTPTVLFPGTEGHMEMPTTGFTDFKENSEVDEFDPNIPVGGLHDGRNVSARRSGSGSSESNQVYESTCIFLGDFHHNDATTTTKN